MNNLHFSQLGISTTIGSWYWRFPLLLILVLLCFSLFVHPARAHPDDPEKIEPFMVNVSLAILDIPKVDEPAETFDIDAYLGLTWRDISAYDELVKNGFSQGNTYQSGSTEEACATLKNIGWFYIIEFANQAKPREILYSSLKIEPDGNIEYLERLQMTLRSEYELNKYPFDTQRLRIRIESFSYDASKMIFSVDRIMFYRPIGSEESRLVLEDWTLTQEIVSESGVTHSQLFGNDWPYIEISIDAQRKSGYHLWKIFLPLILIISISWSVFWIGKESVSSRLSISLIGFLTVISFGFFISSNLPKISYLTLMDYSIIGIYVFMTMTVIEILSTYVLAIHDKEAIASRIDRHSRWLFPLGLFFYFLSIMLLYD